MLNVRTDLNDSDYVNSLIYFGAIEWCMPCKTLKPMLEDLSDKYDNVNFIYVDADDSPDLVQEHQIMSVPTVKLFVNGREEKIFRGLSSKSSFVDALNLYFGD